MVIEGVVVADAVLVSKGDQEEGPGGPEGTLLSVTLAAGDAQFELYGVGRRAAEVPLEVGQRYLFEGATRAFSAAPNLGSVSLRVSDGDGLAFYGARVTGLPGTAPPGTDADQPLLLPGWEVRAEPAGVGSREASCAEETPYRVTFEHGGQSVRLVQGERGRLGSYEVEVRVASRYLYDGSCTDGYRPEFSFVIARARAIA